MADDITISKMAELSGLTPHTLRYYERIGLLQPIGRGADGHRRYAARDVDWLAFIVRLRTTGMPIRQMLAFAEMRRAGDGSIPARRALLETHADEVRMRIEELQACVGVLQEKIVFYRGIESSMNQPPSTTAKKEQSHGQPLRKRARKT